MLSNSLVLHTSGGISSIPAPFLFLIFLSTELSSSCVKCPSSMSSWLLIIFVIGSSVTFGGFLSKFSKCSFHKCIHSSWLAAFSSTSAVIFRQLTSLTACHAILDCLSSTKTLILLIWFCMYSVCSFTNTFQTNSRAKSINKEIKHHERTFQKPMMSRRWSRPKWIKHVTAQVGSPHSSGWNVTLYLQLKRFSFFNQSVTFPSKVFWCRFDPNATIKWLKFKKGNRLQDVERQDRHEPHSDKNKELDVLPIKLAFQHNHRRFIAYRPMSHTVPQY